MLRLMIKRNQMLLSLGFLLSTLANAELKVGQKAPQVKGLTQDGEELDLGSLYAQGRVLVYFYPKADTSGCTAQACSLRDSYEVLQKKGVTIVGVSTDGPKAQKAFKEKHRLPFTLIADEKKTVTKAFEVPLTFGFAKRQAFLIEDGQLKWIDREASTKEQADDVLKVLDGKK
jgi:thioredoxin-dependent peroxiredoxin